MDDNASALVMMYLLNMVNAPYENRGEGVSSSI